MNVTLKASEIPASVLNNLVREDRVHSSIFTDPEIFKLEMERIFRRTWLFALHGSEIPATGDFKLLNLAAQQVIAVRNDAGEINIFVNRCRHRGATICAVPSGNSRHFQCPYHGWTYGLDGGRLSPVKELAGEGESDVNLTHLPRVDEYRGFVFASFAEQGPDLGEFLGEARSFIDIVANYSPSGQIRVDPKVVNKTRYRGNWKQIGMDGYHVHFVHASVVDIFATRKSSAGSAVGALQVEDPWSDASRSRTRGFPFGHAALDLRDQRLQHGKEFRLQVEKSPGGKEYVARMVEIHGAQKAGEIIALHGDPHLGVYPNLQLIHDHLRVVKPISVNETEVYMYPIFLEEVPSQFNVARLRHHEDFYGPASFGSPDDAEIFERTQIGLAAETDPWIRVDRGLARETTDPDGTSVGLIGDEVTQRAQFREWSRLMTGERLMSAKLDAERGDDTNPAG